jgi:pyridinium-3,5-biscarboxylic acid mononucleotide sulfurtransferase
MTPELASKLQSLEDLLSSYSSALIAFSGGVDSTLLAHLCKHYISTDVLLVTAASSTYPQHELAEASAIAAHIGLPHEVIVSEELDINEFVSNPANRCYYCKKELFTKLLRVAKERSLAIVFDGNNADDKSDFRPGHTAALELGILSPFERTGMNKSEIRTLSRLYGLPTAEKPAMACLASRFPYGETITREKLSRVERCERDLHDLGFVQIRVRSHGDLARVEIPENEFTIAFANYREIASILNKNGFIYQCLDLKGYRTGSMNEVLAQ